jgi:hypothetical protein
MTACCGCGPQSTLLSIACPCEGGGRRRHQPPDAFEVRREESTCDYIQATREYLEAHGKPAALYSDKHDIFRVNGTGAVEGMTRWGAPCAIAPSRDQHSRRRR